MFDPAFIFQLSVANDARISCRSPEKKTKSSVHLSEDVFSSDSSDNT